MYLEEALSSIPMGIVGILVFYVELDFVFRLLAPGGKP
jgi:hypothetical protein